MVKDKFTPYTKHPKSGNRAGGGGAGDRGKWRHQTLNQPKARNVQSLFIHVCVPMLKFSQRLAGKRHLTRADFSPVPLRNKCIQLQCKNWLYLDTKNQVHKFTGRKEQAQSHKRELLLTVSLQTEISNIFKMTKLRKENTIMEMPAGGGGDDFKIEMFHSLKK